MKTLQMVSDKLGVHPYDLVGDEEFAQELLDEGTDITDTILDQELKGLAQAEGIEL